MPGAGSWTQLKSPPSSATLTPYFFCIAKRATVTYVARSPSTAIFFPLRSWIDLIKLSFLTQRPKPRGDG